MSGRITRLMLASMFFNCLIMGLRELRANLLRTGLTSLGMVIGVSAVIIVVTVMQGISNQVMQDVSAMARNVIILSPKREPGQQRRIPFRLADADAVERDIRGLAHVAPIASSRMLFSANGREHETEVESSTNAFFDIRNWQLTLGRRFTAPEVIQGSSVCILGQMLRKELFGLQNPVGAMVRSGSFGCRVIGVLAVSGTSFITSDADDVIVLPINTYHRRLAGNSDVQSIWITVTHASAIPRVMTDIETLMHERRAIAPGRPKNFRVLDVREDMQMLNSVALQLSLAVAGVAAISLVVGGIGIMNVMLVSVTERTREIGIRLAVGAAERDVLLQFLIEAVLLSLAGGLAGVVIGLGAAAAIGSAIGVPISVSAEVLALGFGVPTIIGVAFGFFPAWRASRLDPIEALRFE